MRLRRHEVLGVILFAASLATARGVNACDCIGEPPAQTLLARAEVVFVGRVTNVSLPGTWVHQTAISKPGCGFTVKYEGLDIAYCEAEDVVVTLEVARSWKGEVNERVNLLTPPQPTSCGVRFIVGNDYLVYAKKRLSDGALMSESCDGTRHVTEARADIAVLGEAPRNLVVERNSRVEHKK